MNDPQIVTHFVFLAHGSPAPEASREFEALVQQWRVANPSKIALTAYLSLGSPNLPQALADAEQDGAQCIEIVPLLVFSGKHLQVDIPHILATFCKTFPHVKVRQKGPLALRPGFIELLSPSQPDEPAHQKTQEAGPSQPD